MTQALDDTSLFNNGPTDEDDDGGRNGSGTNIMDADGPPKTSQPQQTDAERMFHLFAGMDTHHGYFDPTKAKKNAKGKLDQSEASKTYNKPPTSYLWKRHLKGDYSLGVSPIRFDGTAVWGVIDVDRYDLSHREWAEKIAKLALPLVVCRSKSGGAHLFLFLKEPMPTAELRRHLESMLPLLGLPDKDIGKEKKTEVFPKSDKPTDSRWLNMPYYQEDGGTRYAVNAAGQGLSLYRFLELAEASKVFPADLAAIIATAASRLDDDGEKDDLAEHGITEFEVILEQKLKKIEKAADHDANNTLNKEVFAVGQFASELDLDEDALKRRALDAWRKRGKDESEFNEVWGRAFNDGKRAGNPPWPLTLSGSRLETEFYAYMEMHQYFYLRGDSLWPAASIDGRFGTKNKMKASKWLDVNRAIDQAVWAPGMPKIIVGRQLEGVNWKDVPGTRVYNLYNAPEIVEGDPNDVKIWLDHIRRIYPESADHIVRWFAHRVQRPGEKVNHALVLGGNQGIGKDTVLLPLFEAVGYSNVQMISPKDLFESFNDFVRSVVLVINEVHDLGEHDRYQFYERSKTVTTAPPHIHRFNEKHRRPVPVFNVCGVIMTTNHKTDGLYLPEDDRRTYVAWSDATKEEFDKPYWDAIYDWYYQKGGMANVAAYLRGLDLAGFNPMTEPPKTPAWREIVYANRAPEDADLMDTLELLGNPDAVTVDDLKRVARDDFRERLSLPRFRYQIPHRLETAGYERILNEGMSKGEWKIDGVYRAIYVKKSLDKRERLAAAIARCERDKKEPLP